jgi:predicted metalloprotease
MGTIVLVLAALYFGVDPKVLMGTGMPGQAQSPDFRSGAENQLKDIVSVVLADTEGPRSDLFGPLDGRYRKRTLVLYSGMTRSACGLG